MRRDGRQRVCLYKEKTIYKHPVDTEIYKKKISSHRRSFETLDEDPESAHLRLAACQGGEPGQKNNFAPRRHTSLYQRSALSTDITGSGPAYLAMATPQIVNIPLPALPEGWSAEKDFKAVGTLSSATQRTVEPVGPHFLAHARRVCYPRCSLCRRCFLLCRLCRVFGRRGMAANTPPEASQPHVLRR